MNVIVCRSFTRLRSSARLRLELTPAVRHDICATAMARSDSRCATKLIHGYRSLDLIEFVLETVRGDFPPLIAEIERILNTGAKG